MIQEAILDKKQYILVHVQIALLDYTNIPQSAPKFLLRMLK